MAQINKTPNFLKMAKALKKDLVIYAEKEGEEWFKMSFENQGFTDEALEKWVERKDDIDPGRAILLKSSFLRDSIRVFDSSENEIVFGSDAPYADLHNNGGTIKVSFTTKMKKFFWFMHIKTGQDKWKYMALTTKSMLTIKIPERKFIGESKAFMNKLDTWVLRQIEQRFKKL